MKVSMVLCVVALCFAYSDAQTYRRRPQQNQPYRPQYNPQYNPQYDPRYDTQYNPPYNPQYYPQRGQPQAPRRPYNNYPRGGYNNYGGYNSYNHQQQGQWAGQQQSAGGSTTSSEEVFGVGAGPVGAGPVGYGPVGGGPVGGGPMGLQEKNATDNSTKPETPDVSAPVSPPEVQAAAAGGFAAERTRYDYRGARARAAAARQPVRVAGVAGRQTASSEEVFVPAAVRTRALNSRASYYARMLQLVRQQLAAGGQTASFEVYGAGPNTPYRAVAQTAGGSTDSSEEESSMGGSMGGSTRSYQGSTLSNGPF